ncbi:hypothetical protein NC651_020763 [Populus alba x Populus x berolinensis]|nr:hypothetical protein NC651_020763 [Populus alba x Populus x berolinensis]
MNGYMNFIENQKEEEGIKEHGQNPSQPHKTTNLDNSMEELPGLEIEEKVFKKDSPSSLDDLNVQTREQETTLVDEPDWKQLLMGGTDSREKVPLTEYTSILWNYKSGVGVMVALGGYGGMMICCIDNKMTECNDTGKRWAMVMPWQQHDD